MRVLCAENSEFHVFFKINKSRKKKRNVILEKLNFEKLRMASRFQKKTAPKLPSIPGTKPSLFNFQLLTSSGIPGLDQLLGGGLPLGTLLLIQDIPNNPEQENENDVETGQHYSSLLLQYFLSEGVVHGHKLFVGRVDPGESSL